MTQNGKFSNFELTDFDGFTFSRLISRFYLLFARKSKQKGDGAVDKSLPGVTITNSIISLNQFAVIL